MQRSIALLILFCALGAVVWAGMRLANIVRAPANNLPPIDIAQMEPASVELQEAAHPFLEIYGRLEQQNETKIAQQPLDKPFGYTLKGVVALGQMRWAVLSHDGRDVIVREGELLEGGAKVLRVRAEGIDLAIDDGVVMLGFNAGVPVSMAEIAQDESIDGTSVAKGNFTTETRSAVLFQDMSSDEILAALQEAERQRKERGWVTESE
jgi:hypothetical protein